MIYKLITTRGNNSYEHILSVSDGSSFKRVILWDKESHSGRNAEMINVYAKLNEAQLSKREGLESAVSILKTK